MTYADIRNDIYYLSHTNVNSLSAADLQRIVNKYYGQLQEVVRGVNEDFYLIVASTDLTIGDGSYTYPDGTGTSPAYQKLKSIWAAYQPANTAAPEPTEYVRVDVVDPQSISDPSYTFSPSNPKALAFGTYFQLLPLVTDQTRYPVTDGVKVHYIAQQSDLVNDTDVPKIFPSFHDAIVQGSLIDVAQRIGDMQLKKDSVALFKKRLADIATFASDRLPELLGIVEGQDSLSGWEYPWGQNTMS